MQITWDYNVAISAQRNNTSGGGVTELSASEGGRETKALVSARGVTLMSGRGICHSGVVRGKVLFS